MKKNKKIEPLPFWHPLFQDRASLKNIFIFSTLFIFLIFALFLLGKRHLEKRALPPEIIALQPLQAQHPSTPPMPSAKLQQNLQRAALPSPSSPPLTQGDLKALSDRLHTLEGQLSAQQSMQTPKKLVAVELLRGVLEGWVSLDILKTFLQKNSDPWAQTFLTSLAGIKGCKTYSQLNIELVIPPSQAFSLWDKIKRKIKSLIRIRKLNTNGHYQYVPTEYVQKALQEQNLQQAIELFEKISPEEKASLSSWKKLAQDRLALEAFMKKFLIELSGS